MQSFAKVLLLLFFCCYVLASFPTAIRMHCTEFAFLWVICCMYYSQLFCSDAKLANLEGNLRIIRLHLHENRLKREVNLPNVQPRNLVIRTIHEIQIEFKAHKHNSNCSQGRNKRPPLNSLKSPKGVV